MVRRRGGAHHLTRPLLVGAGRALLNEPQRLRRIAGGASTSILQPGASPLTSGTISIMGMFDEVHTGDRCGQTKALGRSLSQLIPGHYVEIIASGHQTPTATVAAVDGQVLMSEGGYLTICDGLLLSWADDRDLSLPLFDVFGNRIAVEPTTDSDAERHAAVSAVLQEAEGPYEGSDLARLDAIFGTVPALPALREELAHQQALRLYGLPGECELCGEIRTSRAQQPSP